MLRHLTRLKSTVPPRRPHLHMVRFHSSTSRRRKLKSPQFLDFSVLPSNTPSFLQSPTSTTPGWIAAALIFWGLFLIIFSLSTIRGRLGGKLSEILGKPMVARAAAWVGVMGYMIGE